LSWQRRDSVAAGKYSFKLSSPVSEVTTLTTLGGVPIHTATASSGPMNYHWLIRTHTHDTPTWTILCSIHTEDTIPSFDPLALCIISINISI